MLFVRLMMSCVSSTMGLSDVEAAEFIRRAAFVDANALPKDECGVEYKKPSQVQYYGP